MGLSPQKHVQKYRNRFFHQPFRKHGFTLIELMVTMVIISIVTGLSLSGLAGARQRAKIDKTKSTIRKLHEIVMPQYESYLSRRVSATTPRDRLVAMRLLMVQEMPDQWADVYWLEDRNRNTTLDSGEDANANNQLDMPPPGATGSRWSSKSTAYEGAECLAMIVTRGGFAEDAVEAFRTDEVGDIDSDGAPEFRDGWGRPIGFIRWPAGYLSLIQPQNATTNPDPLDPMKISGDYALIPLIYSAGPDEATNDPLSGPGGYGVQTSAAAVPPDATSMGWLSSNRNLRTTRQGTPLAGDYIYLPSGIPDPAAIQATRDNITNHDLLSK
jgi:prepilin-type N-terminal cleavage/methylation domain-containing protein